MKICELYTRKDFVVSCEIFPPKPDFPLATIFDTLNGIAPLKPDYMSVTYGAGGSSCVRTVEIASAVKNAYGIETLAHLTCVGASRQETDRVLEQLKRERIENVLALRGDLPAGDSCVAEYERHEFAKDLIAHIQIQHQFCVAAAAYPEGHFACPDKKTDREHLRQKVEAGADFLITQLFFDNRFFFELVEDVARMGLDIPISAGVMPVLNASQITRMTQLCGASISADLQRLIDLHGKNPAEMEKAGIEYACEQIRKLKQGGARGVHLYTMNKPVQTLEILRRTGLRA